MTYEEFIANLVPRMISALNSVRTTLIAAGIPASRITGPVEVNSSDLRYRLTASTGSGQSAKSLDIWIELTDSYHLGGPQEGKAILTLFVQGTSGGTSSEITTNYSAGTVVSYVDDTGIQDLLTRLTNLEGAIPGAITKIRNFFGI